MKDCLLHFEVRKHQIFGVKISGKKEPSSQLLDTICRLYFVEQNQMVDLRAKRRNGYNETM